MYLPVLNEGIPQPWHDFGQNGLHGSGWIVMAAADKLFAGAIPDIYDRLMVPLLFEFYAHDLARRLASFEPQDVLEMAAGTGALTRAIVARLLMSARIIATDLNQAMLDRDGRELPGGSRVA